jgi:quinol monooxygenase YgiN
LLVRERSGFENWKASSIETCRFTDKDPQEDVMGQIQGIARLKIHEGKLAEFKRLVAKCEEIVRTKDTGTLQYENYLNSDETECVALERYRDEQALLDHFEHIREAMDEILTTCSGEGELCGDISPELAEKLKGGPVRVFRPFEASRS